MSKCPKNAQFRDKISTLEDTLEITSARYVLMVLASGVGISRNFLTGELTLPTRGLEYGFQGIVKAKTLRQNSFSPSDGGLACSNRRL